MGSSWSTDLDSWTLGATVHGWLMAEKVDKMTLVQTDGEEREQD